MVAASSFQRFHHQDNNGISLCKAMCYCEQCFSSIKLAQDLMDLELIPSQNALGIARNVKNEQIY